MNVTKELIKRANRGESLSDIELEYLVKYYENLYASILVLGCRYDIFVGAIGREYEHYERMRNDRQRI